MYLALFQPMAGMRNELPHPDPLPPNSLFEGLTRVSLVQKATTASMAACSSASFRFFRSIFAQTSPETLAFNNCLRATALLKVRLFMPMHLAAASIHWLSPAIITAASMTFRAQWLSLPIAYFKPDQASAIPLQTTRQAYNSLHWTTISWRTASMSGCSKNRSTIAL
jgi:hypothetical protein